MALDGKLSSLTTRLVLTLLGMAACDKVDADLLRLSPPPRLAGEARAADRPSTFIPAPTSVLRVSLGKRSEATLELSARGGSFTLFPDNLRRLRGRLQIPLDRVASRQEAFQGPSDLETALRGHAQTSPHADRQSSAVLEVREVVSAQPESLRLATPKLVSGQLMLEARLLVRADLELGGVRSELEIPLRLTCPTGKDGADLKRLQLQSDGTIELPLAAHGMLRSPAQVASLRTARASLWLPLLATEE